MEDNHNPPSSVSDNARVIEDLFEASVEARWDNVSNLCDDLAQTRRSPSSDVTSEDLSFPTFSNVDPGGDEARRNPLMAAVLHVAIDVAAAQRSVSLFSDAATQEIIDSEERNRSQPGGPTAVSQPLTAADFSPYFQMRVCSEDDCAIDDGCRRARRKAIAKLCRSNPEWIRLPMNPLDRIDGDGGEDDSPRGITPLHVAVRTRNHTLVKLLLKYCPEAAEVADGDGCLPLHHAVRPPDELLVLRRAAVNLGSSRNGTSAVDQMGTVPGGVSSGITLRCRAENIFKATRDNATMGRYRVRRIKRRWTLRQLSRSHNNGRMDADATTSNNAGHTNNDSPRSDVNGTFAFSNMYESPALLVRAMMCLGTVEEDSCDFISQEWGLSKDSSGNRITSEYPLLNDPSRVVSRGVIRPTRPWKCENSRIDIIRHLTQCYRVGVSCQSDDGGETPLILACRTLKGGTEEDENDDDLDEDDLEGVLLGGETEDDQAADETGEDRADYEIDIPDTTNRQSPSNAVNDSLQHNHAAIERNNNGREPDQRQEADPLEAVWIMINADHLNREEALGTPDDEGDTPLHTATRIGAHSRLVLRLLEALPPSASAPAEDGATPLHLACRRACHLAPGGPGGLATYDAETIRLLADAAGPGTLAAADDEGRTPIHVACHYGASPAVLADLADSDGGRDALLVRDMEGHTPLGVYCRHASDFHGLRVLVERRPEAAAAVGDGRRLPLHRVLANFNLTVNVDVLRLLGSAYRRGLDSLDAHGMTPLALLCASYRTPLNGDIPKLREGRLTLGRCLSNKIWLMAKYLLLASQANRRWTRYRETAYSSNEDRAHVGPPVERMLHVALREPASSVELVMLTLCIYPNQLSEADEDGNFPLHLCCKRRSGCTQIIQDSANELSQCELSSDDDSVFNVVNEDSLIDQESYDFDVTTTNRTLTASRRQYNSNDNFLPILHTILRHDRSASGRRNGDNKYPLNLLIDRGSSWFGGGVDKVFKAFPGALFSYHLSNGVFAMALARAASFVNTNPEQLVVEQAASLGALYELLRGKPTAVEGVISKNTCQKVVSNVAHAIDDDREETKSKRARIG